MKYIDEYRSSQRCKKIVSLINEFDLKKGINLMEVCGTHTANFFRFGLKKLLPNKINFISGPGCPVCVSHQSYIDKAIELSKNKDIIIATFGDMLRVPGTNASLEKQRSQGTDIRIVYSCLDSLDIAKKRKDKKIVFLGVGFETTSPTIAATILTARKERIKNFFILPSFKLIPPAMKALLKDKVNIDGFLCPGHVSTIIGLRPYEDIAAGYKIPCVIAGFEPLDILEGIYMLTRQIMKKEARVENQYIRAVEHNGNPAALKIINKVFKVSFENWRGIGKIDKSGLRLKDAFIDFDAEKFISGFKSKITSEEKCRCGEVLKGLIRPKECKYFRRVCSPQNPLGPCMVSSEGACGIYYRYEKL